MKNIFKTAPKLRSNITILFSIIIVSLMVCVAGCDNNDPPKEEPPVFEAHYTHFDSLAFEYVNEYRDSTGLPHLQQHPALWVVANEHSTNMKEGKVVIGHDGFDERATYLQKWMTPVGYGHVGENVAYIKLTNMDKLISYWLSSPTHKANLDGEFIYADLSCVPDSLNNYCFITMMLYE